MASFYPSLSSDGDMLTTPYLLNQNRPRLSSDLENHKAVLLSYQNLLSSGSLSGHDLVGTNPSTGSRDEVLFIPPTGGMQQQMDRQINIGDTVGADNSLLSNGKMHSHGQCHGLSLTLGSQDTSLVHLHSDLNQYPGSSFHPLLSSNVQSDRHLSQNNRLIKNAQYMSLNFTGQNQDPVGNQNLISSEGASFARSPHVSEFTVNLCNSRYLKALQDLLDELVSVHGVPKLSEEVHNLNSLGQDGTSETNSKRDVVYAELQESTNIATPDLSPTKRQDLQDKFTKLLSMLDEVDKRYEQYCNQMQVLSSSFDMLAGRGAARPYIGLALGTISRRFRCLRDAIKKQMQAAEKSLGEQDAGLNGVGVLPRLRHVDQQLKQQKALQQFGVIRQPWKPQRGLPESAVSVLRAWLFEHFFHPYPKDSEKIVLGKQTGLTRNQVANWFINARVRLWKPMIEKMYKEEFGDAKNDPKSLSEREATIQENPKFEHREEEFHPGRLMSPATSDGNCHRTNDWAPGVNSSSPSNANRTGLICEAQTIPDNEVNFEFMHTQRDKQTVNNQQVHECSSRLISSRDHACR